MYDYKMVQIPPAIRINQKDAKGREAAQYLEDIVKQNAVNNWEFYRVDEIGVREEPGCLAALVGQKSVYLNYYVVTFRKPKSA